MNTSGKMDTVGILFENGAADESRAVVFERSELTYGQLRRRALNVRDRLLDQGVRLGDKVGLILDNSLEVWETNFGIWAAGGVCVPLNHRLAIPEIVGLVRFADIRIAVIDGSNRDLFDALTAAGTGILDSRDNVEAVANNPGEAEQYPVDPRACERRDAQDLAQIIFTSGSTGTPKGVQHTHQAVVWSTLATALEHGVNRTDKVYAIVGANYVGGRGTALPVLQCGGEVHLRRSGGFSGEEFVDYAGRHGLTRTILSAPMLADVVETLERRGETLPAFRMIVAGGMAFSEELLMRARVVLPGARVSQNYGSTETFGATIQEPEIEMSRISSTGLPDLHTVISIVAPLEDRLLGAGAEGEIVVQSPCITSGHYKMDNEASFSKYGWRTGDLGYLDAQGYLYITGRIREIIISGGMNIYPLEVEESLKTHPGIKEVGVAAVPDKRWGESVLAAIIPADDTRPPSLEDLQAHCRERIASFKKPTRLLILDELPKTDVGKIRRTAIKQKWIDLGLTVEIECDARKSPLKTPLPQD